MLQLARLVCTLVVLMLLLVGCSTPERAVLSAGKPYTIHPGQGNQDDRTWDHFNEAYHDPQRTKLTDGLIGTSRFADGRYSGFRWTERDDDGKHINHPVAITIDLGSSQEIASVRSHWAWHDTANIRYPDRLTVSVSDDVVHWSSAQSTAIQNPNMDGEPTWFSIPIAATGRYVKLEWIALDHWYHLSEIEVFGPGVR